MQWIDEEVLKRICSWIRRAFLFWEFGEIKITIKPINRRSKKLTGERRKPNWKLIIFLLYTILLKFSYKLSYHSIFVLFYTLDFWDYIFSLAKSTSFMGLKIYLWMDIRFYLQVIYNENFQLLKVFNISFDIPCTIKTYKFNWNYKRRSKGSFKSKKILLLNPLLIKIYNN